MKEYSKRHVLWRLNDWRQPTPFPPSESSYLKELVERDLKTKKITIVQLTDWHLVYVGEKLEYEDESVSASDLERIVGEDPFTLRIVDAEGTELDEIVANAGFVDPELTLTEVLEMREYQ